MKMFADNTHDILVMNAPASGPDDAVKFGDKTREKKPYFNCNTQHRVQGWFTVSGSDNKPHALTDSIIVDVRLRDTDDGFKYNSNYAQNHKVGLKLTHDGQEIYSWTTSGIQDADTDDWKSSTPYLITKPGTWKLYMKSLEHHSCGIIGGDWKKVGEFVAQEAHEDCFMQNRQDTDELGVCGDCLAGFEEVNGECQAVEQNGMGGATTVAGGYQMDNTTIVVVGGAIFLLAMLLRKKE
jgi:hypothetical protein